MSSSGFNLEKFLIPLDEIERATKSFSSETRIGDGTFGEVYKGQLSEPWNNCTAAIKCLFSNEYQGKDEFLHELKMISSFDHENIIRFTGYCDEGKHMIIVSEYASNGSLDDHLGDPNKIRYITWEQRLKICLGVAKGLDYLHLGLKDYNSVIHRDIKSGNILLDDNMEAKICDFGLSVSSSTHRNQIIHLHAAGTNFYLDPLYRESGFLWKESDIYSLGVVMFEMLSGMLAYDTRSLGDDKPQPLINLVRRYYDDGLDRLIDPHIRDDIHTCSFLEFKNIAYQCISLDLGQRPWMHQIIGSLKYALDVQGSSSFARLRPWRIFGRLRLNLATRCSAWIRTWGRWDIPPHPSKPYPMMNINTNAGEGKFDNTHSNDYEDPNDYAVKIKELHSNIHDEEIPKIKRLFSTMSTIQSQEYQKTMSSSGLKLQKFLIPLEEINRATKSFTSEMIGDGGFGKVYKGQLSEQWQSRTAAIKRLDQKSYKGKRETFLNELNMISGFQHKNIIPFIGYCDEGNEFIIVSEYASNGSLDDHLIDPKKSRLLTWAERLKICLGAAKGINYLHSGLGDDNRVIHRDVKSANILLDGNMEAKICDFGLSKSGPRNQQHTQLYTNVAGTFSYMDPVFQESGILRKESDVYSFGVVMFEMLSGMLAYKERSIGGCEPQYLINLVRSNYYDGLYNLIDQHIEDHIDLKSFDTVKEIAYQCLSFKFEERPKMDGIIKRIEEALNIQESSIGNSRSTLLKDQREILPSSRGVHRINFYGIQEWTKYQ